MKLENYKEMGEETFLRTIEGSTLEHNLELLLEWIRQSSNLNYDLSAAKYTKDGPIVYRIMIKTLGKGRELFETHSPKIKDSIDMVLSYLKSEEL